MLIVMYVRVRANKEKNVSRNIRYIRKTYKALQKETINMTLMILRVIFHSYYNNKMHVSLHISKINFGIKIDFAMLDCDS